MIVNVVDYGIKGDKNFIDYEISGLSQGQIEYLCLNLGDETSAGDGILKMTVYFKPEYYPFQSDIAKIKQDDFIAREEIEMNAFLSEFLEDMQDDLRKFK